MRSFVCVAWASAHCFQGRSFRSSGCLCCAFVCLCAQCVFVFVFVFVFVCLCLCVCMCVASRAFVRAAVHIGSVLRRVLLSDIAFRTFVVMCLSRVWFACSVGLANAALIPAAGGTVPVVDVSLAPLEAPSEFVGAIASVDSARAAFEKTVMEADVRAFNAALQAAGPRIDAIAKQAVRALAVADGQRAAASSSFLAGGGTRRGRGGGEVVEVEVPVGKPIDVSAVVAGVRSSEGKRAAEDALEFGAWLADFNSLTDFVVRGAGAVAESLSPGGRLAAASFLEVPARAGRSAAAVANLAVRRGMGEELVRAKHLALSIALLHRENQMLRAALRREVVASRAVGASFVGAAANVAAAGLDQYTLNLIPPAEDERDTVSQIDDVMLAERAKQAAANALFADEKQRALDAEKLELRRAAQRSMR